MAASDPSAPERRSTVSTMRKSLRPRLSSTPAASPPDWLICPIPLTKLSSAAIASLCHAAAKSAADMPATRAKLSSSSPPPSTALLMCCMVRLMALPPASALMPREDMVALRPMTWALVSPSRLPVPARRWAISAISDSVVAQLLPSATITLPRLPIWSRGICITLAYWASMEAAASPDRLVVTPRLAMVRVKSRRFP